MGAAFLARDLRLERDVAVKTLTGVSVLRLMGLKPGPVPAAHAVDIGALLADALAALHEAGYMHGDIKPSNVGLTSDGSPKLLDFGLARATSAAATRGGTVRYLSPEVLSGRPADEADECLVPVRDAGSARAEISLKGQGFGAAPEVGSADALGS